ncbi:MAG: hypothetical protein QY317_16150 [Candidatus Jettenia caeni]|nr:MAG: hypothetical protein QY317_16150 [Candidatus Jettenia caeni]
MADIKYLKFVATIAGTKEILIEDVPEGLQFQRNHIRPVSPRRTQSGTLITQTIVYNKKSISVSGGVYKKDIVDYFKTAYENNETVTFTIYDYDSNYQLINEAVHSVKIMRFEDSKDFNESTRSWSVEFEEI